jgi:hypothetical protein
MHLLPPAALPAPIVYGSVVAACLHDAAFAALVIAAVAVAAAVVVAATVAAAAAAVPCGHFLSLLPRGVY